MNSLSWLIYGAGVVEHLSLFAWVVVLGATVWGILANCAIAFHNDSSLYSGGQKKPYFAKPFAVVVAVFVIMTPVPTKQTIYLIAASEVGERAIQTEEARDMLDILRKELKKMKDAN